MTEKIKEKIKEEEEISLTDEEKGHIGQGCPSGIDLSVPRECADSRLIFRTCQIGGLQGMGGDEG